MHRSPWWWLAPLLLILMAGSLAVILWAFLLLEAFARFAVIFGGGAVLS